MDCTEVQLTDWVMKDGEPVRVEGIHSTDLDRCLWKYVEPIPLSGEILKLNGFTYRVPTDDDFEVFSASEDMLAELTKFWVYLDDKNHKISLKFPAEPDGGVVFIQPGGRYLTFVWNDTLMVHEFQNLLRSAGMKKLANTFKIINI